MGELRVLSRNFNEKWVSCLHEDLKYVVEALDSNSSIQQYLKKRKAWRPSGMNVTDVVTGIPLNTLSESTTKRIVFLHEIGGENLFKIIHGKVGF